MKNSHVLILSFVFLILNSCMVVKPYNQVKLNDPDMKLEDRKANKFETTFQSYREGSSGGNGGKSGGGCGCN